MIQVEKPLPNKMLADPSLVARQPICDTSQRTIAYELLYRHSRENFATIRNADQATAHVIVNSFLEIGIDRIVGSSLAFINVTREFILSDYCRSLPKDRVVFEILENTVVDRPLVEAVQRLSRDQYRFALDDFGEITPALEQVQ